MKITVKVIPNSTQEKIIYSAGEKMYTIWTHSKAIEGEANKKVIQILSIYLGIPKSHLKLIVGAKARNKVFEIE